MPTLATIDSCTGCGACYNICPHSAIAMKPDSKGFIVPFVESYKCVECKLCEKACPIVNGKKEELKNNNPIRVLALWSKTDRTKSSSGGAFSEIAKHVLTQKGLVYGASWTDNFHCHHIGIDSVNELEALRGSKYLQSSIGDSYKIIRHELRSGRIVLFTGTPCQVVGLKSYLMKPYDNLICVDLVCHGVPSNYLFCNYIDK